MYAEALTKNIVNALFPANSGSSGGSGFNFESQYGIDYGFAEGGHVVGEGTGTSDSILARLSNGEFVINAAAVKQVGLDTLHRINNGRAFEIPMPRFALGGFVGDSGAGAAIKGMESFSTNFGTNLGASLGTNFNPSIHNVTELRFDGKQFDHMLEAKTKSVIRNNMMEIVMLANKTGRIR